jgi:hypothetical protein
MCLRDKFQEWTTIEPNDSDKSFDKEACEWQKTDGRRSVLAELAEPGREFITGWAPPKPLPGCAPDLTRHW